MLQVFSLPPFYLLLNIISPGWSPTDFGLKDHHIFWHDGYYYLVSIYVPPDDNSPFAQDRFVYARSEDLCEWEDLSPILSTRIPNTLDEQAIWAPFVYYENGIYYLYYTGVTEDVTQSILLVTSNDPSDPSSWQPQEMVFQPDHPGMVWEEGRWADCRDPAVVKIEDIYYLFYTGRDTEGAIIGAATADKPTGPWEDQGSILDPKINVMLESPTLVRFGNFFYLFYNLSRVGEQYRIGESPTGPWGEPIPFQPGWAHEIWQNPDNKWFTSYLTDYSVTIRPLSWDIHNDLPHPIINTNEIKIFFPLVLNK
jgi:beta-xylosidase